MVLRSKQERRRMNETRPLILIVDDEQEIIEVLKEHFKERNCEAIATQDPATVVDKLRNFQVTLMLLDLKMRELDGFQVLDRIRGAGIKLPPTLILTGFFPRFKEKLMRYGIDERDVIKKPFGFETIESQINRKLGAQILTSEVGSKYEDKIYEENRCRIGVVEDEEDILHYFAEFFGERNYKMSCFKNGREALEVLKKYPVDILMVDIKLPGMPGDGLIEELSKEPNAPYMIAMSADSPDPALARRLKQAGCQDYLTKPLETFELIEKIKTIAIEKGLLG